MVVLKIISVWQGTTDASVEIVVPRDTTDGSAQFHKALSDGSAVGNATG